MVLEDRQSRGFRVDRRKMGRWGDGKYPGVEGYLVQELGLEVTDIEKIRKNLPSGKV